MTYAGDPTGPRKITNAKRRRELATTAKTVYEAVTPEDSILTMDSDAVWELCEQFAKDVQALRDK